MSTTSVIISCRGLGKTFITALFCVIRCILYPGTSICVCSKTRKQGAEIIKKIKDILMPNSVMLRLEVDEIVTNQYESTVSFKNTSVMKVVTANDNARGQRCNILIIDEFRMVDPKIYSLVLKKFLNVNRQPGYLSKPEYSGMTAEENIECFLSSAFYCDNWSYDKFRTTAAQMITGSRPYWCCAFPYNLAVKEGLLSRERVISERTDPLYNEVTWAMEMDALFFNGSESSLYAYEDTAAAQQIKFAFYPPDVASLISDKRIKLPPKMHNEVRILSADIALMASTHGKDNDATSIHINQLLLGNGSDAVSNIVYTVNNEGYTTDEEALTIRRMFYQFDCDYLVIDCRGLGLGVVDKLMSDIYDPANGVVYGALSCYNDPDIAARCRVKNAPKVIYAVNASVDFNSRIALGLREMIKQGRVRLLRQADDFDEYAPELTGYNKLSTEDKLKFKLPFINTDLLINELVSLQYETHNGVVRVKERYGARKDRYSSLAYNIEVAKEIEREYAQRTVQNDFSAFLLQFKEPNIFR